MGEGQFFYLFWSGLDFSLIPERTKVQPWEPSFFQGYIFHYIPKLGYEKHDYLWDNLIFPPFRSIFPGEEKSLDACEDLAGTSSGTAGRVINEELQNAAGTASGSVQVGPSGCRG